MTKREQYRLYLASDHWTQLKKAKFFKVGRECEVCAADRRIQVHHCQYRNLTDCTTEDLLVLCETCHRFYHDFVRRNRIDMEQPPAQACKWIADGLGITPRDREQRKQSRRELKMLRHRRQKRGKDSKKDRRRLRNLAKTKARLAEWETGINSRDERTRQIALMKCDQLRREISKQIHQLTLNVPSFAARAFTPPKPAAEREGNFVKHDGKWIYEPII